MSTDPSGIPPSVSHTLLGCGLSVFVLSGEARKANHRKNQWPSLPDCDALPRRFPSPAYRAVIVWVPAAKLLVTVATPDEERVAVPRIADPLRKVTVPVGTADPVPFTIARRERACHI